MIGTFCFQAYLCIISAPSVGRQLVTLRSKSHALLNSQPGAPSVVIFIHFFLSGLEAQRVTS